MYEVKLTQLQAKAVWSVLVAVCGAHKDEQDDFVRLAQETDRLEYRFQGCLGFGGKVFVERDCPRVSCYEEHETLERKEKIGQANGILKIIAKLWVEQESVRTARCS